MGATVNTPEAVEVLEAILAHLFPNEYELGDQDGEVVVRRAPAEHHDTVVQLHIKPDGTAYVLSRLLEEDDWSHMWQLKRAVIERIVDVDEVTEEVVWAESDQAMEWRRVEAVATEGLVGAGFLR